MIILDTNVVSELMRREPDSKVMDWLNGLPHRDVWLTTISIFELRFDIEALAAGQRRRQLEDSFAQILETGFADRILDFDAKAAGAAAAFSAKRRRAGHSHDIRDTFIAGIAISKDAELATRNIRHFGGLDLRVIDPWSE